jgi:hypothetical protein
MSFAVNNNNQLTLSDRTSNLTDREIKFLEKSWAKPFAENIFPLIREEDFAVLYSDNRATRPNSPVNVTVGSMILKELLGLSDDEVMESMMFDVRFQYALHTTSYEEQPISDRTLSRFRNRCIEYENETGVDLIKECITGLAGSIAKLMGITPGLKRMDSMMVASNIKRLSRLELIYTCVADMVKLLQKSGDTVPSGMEHYCEDGDRNKVIYHARSEDTEQRVKSILADAAVLIELCKAGYSEIKEYSLLTRVTDEQTTRNKDGSLELKEKGDPAMDSSILQSPVDPDATFRQKSGKGHIGYVANLIEDVDDGKSVITGYDFQKNIYSDSEFLKDAVETLGLQEKPTTILTDGAYGGEENISTAKGNNINLVTTNMQGRKPNSIYADFEFSDDGKEILRCAGGQAPAANSYNPKTGQRRATFDRQVCEGCPFQGQCRPKFNKTKTSLVLSLKSTKRAEQLRYMETEEFKELAKIRNGVESLPSVLRRKHHVDNMPSRGALKMKLLFGLKVAAVNFKKLLDYQSSLVKYARQPGLC